GGLVEALSEIYLEEVEKTVENNVLECYADTFKIKLAKLGDDAGAIGAGIWAAQQLKEKTPVAETVANSEPQSDESLATNEA
ncbi:MAG: hypothetical protein ACK57P_01840, partial [Planctomycetota bacterium]